MKKCLLVIRRKYNCKKISIRTLYFEHIYYSKVIEKCPNFLLSTKLEPNESYKNVKTQIYNFLEDWHF